MVVLDLGQGLLAVLLDDVEGGGCVGAVVGLAVAWMGGENVGGVGGLGCVRHGCFEVWKVVGSLGVLMVWVLG